MLLPTDLWAGALIRRAELAGAYAAVIRKGDARAGSVLVKVIDRRESRAWLYSEAFGPDGDRLWMRPIASEDEAEIDAYVARSIGRDPDLWVVEIDDPQGRHFLTEPVESR